MPQAGYSESSPLTENVPLPPVFIQFVDPTTYSGWDGEPKSDRPSMCFALGFLAYADSDKVVLAGMFSPGGDEGDDEYNSRMVIPRSCIIYMAGAPSDEDR